MRIYRNLKVWSMYADQEESLGTFEVSYYIRIVNFFFFLNSTLTRNLILKHESYGLIET